MKRIGLLSDTHGYVHPSAFEFFKDCDEIWHAGDIGDIGSMQALRHFKPFKAVYGNIDGQDIRKTFPEIQCFSCEKVKVLIRHIAGYPGHYNASSREIIERESPQLFITGHSHILKVMYDKHFGHLHINPGAAGVYGFHKSLTMVRFIIEGNLVKDLEVLDIPRSIMPDSAI